MKAAHVVLGATSAIGRALAETIAGQGEAVIVAARDADELANIACDLRTRYGSPVAEVVFDAEDFSRHSALVDTCWRLSDGIAGVTATYGAMFDQEGAERDFALAKRMIDVNFASVVSVLSLFAVRLVEQGSGYLCGVGSVAGDRGRQSNFIYGATKAAVATYLAGLRNRLARHGVHVLTVKPGFVDSSMTWGRVNPESPLLASPERVARDIYGALLRRKNTLYTPWFWWYIMRVIGAIPESVFKRLKL